MQPWAIGWNRSQSAMTWMNRIFQGLTCLLFPQVRCLNCKEPRRITPGDVLCDACQMSLEQLRISPSACGRCLSPVRQGKACSFCAQAGLGLIGRAYAPYVYREAVQRLIVGLKFGAVAGAALPLAKAMAPCISGQHFDALVPVPLFRSNQRERGFNQAELLCRQVGDALQSPVLHALIKIRRTRRQSSLSARRRAANVKGAFRCVADVKGKRLLLVDDVRTTGSTVRECAAQLLHGGALEVCLLTAAVAKAKDKKMMWVRRADHGT